MISGLEGGTLQARYEMVMVFIKIMTCEVMVHSLVRRFLQFKIRRILPEC